jgi:uncharacterized protein (TIRG00374 family)
MSSSTSSRSPLSTSNPAPPAPASRRLLAGAVVLATLGLLYWILRGTSVAEILGHLRSAHLGPLLAAVALATATFGVRAIRWHYLIRRDDGGPVEPRALWHATAMGFMANNTLPLRLGELVRSYAISRLGRVSLGAALSSIAVERALDLLTLLALLAAALLGAGLPASTQVMGARLDTLAIRAGLLCLAIFAGAMGVILFPRLAERAVRAVVTFRKLADRVVNLLEALRHGFAVLRDPARLAPAVLWSAGHWLLNASSFYVAFFAFDIRVGFAGALLVQTLLAFGVAAPSTPGYFGVFELVTAAALALFAVPASLGVAYGVTYHIATFLPIVLLGLGSLARTGLRLREVRAAAP